MAARVIDGKAVAAAVRERVKVDVAAYAEEAGRAPVLATVLVGEDPASEIYVAQQAQGLRGGRDALGPPRARGGDREARAAGRWSRGSAPTTRSTASSCSCRCPTTSTPTRWSRAIDPRKDVDGLTPVNAGLLAHGTPGLVPCTPAGVMELLAHEGVELEGAEAVVVGRSKLVGVPVARLLLMANATVTICHSRTRDLDAVCARADVLVAAVGVPRLLGAAAVKPGAVVIDVGMNRLEDGLCGDVDYEAAAEVAAAITPVPGGVGPMTIAMLLVNTLQAARRRV